MRATCSLAPRLGAVSEKMIILMSGVVVLMLLPLKDHCVKLPGQLGAQTRIFFPHHIINKLNKLKLRSRVTKILKCLTVRIFVMSLCHSVLSLWQTRALPAVEDSLPRVLWLSSAEPAGQSAQMGHIGQVPQKKSNTRCLKL
ncbi:hypothetical protein PoB_005563000 [Plakobranchus ocellatus]|uniref:Uncharacterized protein n=1 Tax=Plakobranchus ocellatus TaxID=259542 RepID=A0AAV4C8S9_9GAST|nr:hypothetical protein PoB_005563000 [Plakobranchus ocellatus]